MFDMIGVAPICVRADREVQGSICECLTLPDNPLSSTFNTTTEVRLEQGTEPPTALRAPQHWLPTALGVCVHLDGLNEHKFWVWITILGHTSLHFT